VDSTENNYTIKWGYDNHESSTEYEDYEEEVLGKMDNIPTIFSTDEFGSYEKILNSLEMKKALNDSYSEWQKNNQEQTDSIKEYMQYMITTLNSVFDSDSQLKFWSKELRIFHFLYGKSIKRNTINEGISFYTNPFIQTIMPGEQQLKVVAVDEKNWIAKINVKSGISGDKAKKLMIDFVKKNLDRFGISNEEEIKENELPNYSVSEEYDFVYDIDTGYILKLNYSKLTKVNDDSKLTTYEFKMRR